MATYTMQDLLYGVGGDQASPTGGMVGKLSYRQTVQDEGGLQNLADAILELSRSYRFEGLEETGPLYTLTPNQSSYAISHFTNFGTEIVNLEPSFYMYYNGVGNQGANPGTTLKWKTIDALELMFNTPGTPAYFTRYQGKIWVAPVPIMTFVTYLRYQIQHPFTQPVALGDPFLLPNEWREIAEYAGALRHATNTRMLDYATQYHNLLFGDPKIPSDIGIIQRRISQNEGDSISMMKQIRVAINRI